MVHLYQRRRSREQVGFDRFQSVPFLAVCIHTYICVGKIIPTLVPGI